MFCMNESVFLFKCISCTVIRNEKVINSRKSNIQTHANTTTYTGNRGEIDYKGQHINCNNNHKQQIVMFVEHFNTYYAVVWWRKNIAINFTFNRKMVAIL